MSERRKRSKGFTLIELLVVIMIIGILATVVLPRLSGRTEQARRAAARAQLENLNLALDTYEIDNGDYPTTGEGLEALWTQSASAPNWNGPYLKKAVRTDTWGNPWHYVCPGTHNPSGYDLASFGKDGAEGTDDDITNW